MAGVDHVVGNAAGRQPLQHIEAIMDVAFTEYTTHTFPSAHPASTA